MNDITEGLSSNARSGLTSLIGQGGINRMQDITEASRLVTEAMMLCTFAAYDKLEELDEETYAMLSKKVGKIHARLLVDEVLTPGASLEELSRSIPKQTMFLARCIAEDHIGVPRTDGTETGSMPK